MDLSKKLIEYYNVNKPCNKLEYSIQIAWVIFLNVS